MQNGSLSVSTSYVERNTIVNLQKDVISENDADRDVGFWVGLGPEGEWKSVRSLLPLSVVPKSLENEFFAMEVVMKNGKKHVIFRSLVTVVNDSDVRLNIFTCHSSLSLGTDSLHRVSSNLSAVEEVFQNQYYHPTSGWGNKWPTHLEKVGQWNTRDFSRSSKVLCLFNFIYHLNFYGCYYYVCNVFHSCHCQGLLRTAATSRVEMDVRMDH